MSPAKLKRRFPWLNVDGIALGSYGYENEGWFDPWALMTCFKMKAISLGVDFIPGEVHNLAHRTNDEKVNQNKTELTLAIFTTLASDMARTRRGGGRGEAALEPRHRGSHSS